MEWIADPQAWIAFLTLAALEIVLGIDNIVFISILVGKLPAHQQARAYRIGLGLAMVMRILLLLSLSWIMGLTEPLFTVPLMGARDHRAGPGPDRGGPVPGREEHPRDPRQARRATRARSRPGSRLPTPPSSLQIMALDIVFSLDSVITAVGMVQQVGIMIAAVVAAVLVMMAFARSIGDFVSRHPTIKMLALSFLLAIGVMLWRTASATTCPKGYIYFAMAFSLVVEMLNLRAGHRETPVHLRQAYVAEKAAAKE